MTVELNDLTEGLLVKVLGFEAAMFLVRNLKSWFPSFKALDKVPQDGYLDLGY